MDISGFTRLSGQFCALGKEGIDGLQQATNGYMGKLVEVIYQHGGDIIKFAGDAIICVFVEKEVKESLRTSGTGISCGTLSSSEVSVDVCKQVMVCAMTLREICTDNLTVHVALSCGELCLGIVGGHSDKFECLISGSCLMEMSQCLDDTKSKEVAVSASFAKLVGAHALLDFGGLKLSSGNYLLRFMPTLNLPRLLADNSEEEEAVVDYVIMSSKPEYMRLVNMFVPLPVSLAFESGGLRYLAEIREVTAMFMKWDSYDLEGNRDIITLHSPFLQIQAIVAEQGGFIRQFLVDDKGCVLIACWGVHTASYLNNATRALASAVNIRDLFESKSLRCSIGITTGNVYCGIVGSEIRREYAAIGDTVNLSARLMSKTKGGIFIDESTHSRLPLVIWKRFIFLDPMHIKGKSLPIKAYSFEASASISDVLTTAQEPANEEYGIKLPCRITLLKLLESQSKWIRDRELKANADSHSEQAGMCSVVYLEGKMGSGKATAVKWFVREAKKRDIRVIRVKNIESQDLLLEYKALSKLLVECIGHDVFAESNKQRLVTMHILRSIYCGDNSTANLSCGPTNMTSPSLAPKENNTESTTPTHHNPHYFPKASRIASGNEYIDKVALPVLRMVLGSVVINGNVPLHASDSLRFNIGEKSDRSSAYATNKRIHIKLVCETVRDIISFYLSEEPTVIVIENVHFADENSLKVLACLRDTPAHGVLLITSLPADDVFADFSRTPRNHSPISRHETIYSEGEGNALSSTLKKSSADALESFKTMMCQSSMSHFVRIDEFNLSEIEGMLCSALSIDNVPLGLAQWVQTLSGGSIYWINEMLEFIKTTGIENFMSITATQHSPAKMKTVRRHSSSTQRHTSAVSLRNSDEKGCEMRSAHANNSAAMTETSSYMPTGGLTSPLSCRNAVGNTTSSVPLDPPSISVNINGCVHEAKLSQLQHFIISRFERLPLDDQRILKKASVIGFDFSRYVLYGILSPGLKAHLNVALKNLVKEKWIAKTYQTGSSERPTTGSNGIVSSHDAEYIFAHAMAWDTLYNLIPPGDRKEIHNIVANYYGNMGSSEDPVLYERISFHYSYCDKPRALEYAVKAAVMYLLPPHDSLQEAINVLLAAIKLVQTVADLKVFSSALEAGKGMFYADYGPSIMEGDATPNGLSRNVSLSERTVPRPRRRSFFAWCSCTKNSAVVPVGNSITFVNLPSGDRKSSAKPPRRGISKPDMLGHLVAGGNMMESSRSLASNMSHISVQSLNDKGRDCMMRVLRHLDKEVEKRYSDLVQEKKIGDTLRWHKDIIRDLRAVDGDDGNESQKSRGSGKRNAPM
ncbi:hypothetical protein EON64_00810 [archaeon]|nr:MAG: hypothetical protein EON64_00810 [archaeon]